MKKLLFILFLIPFLASAQWKEDGTSQRWKITVYLKDSVTGRQLDSVEGCWGRTYRRWWHNKDGSIDSTKGADWSNFKTLQYPNFQFIPWSMYDHYSAENPKTHKRHEH